MDESRTIRVSVEEAATLLGIEKGSVKKRIQRGKIRSEKDDSGTTWVYLDRSETVQDQSQGPSETTDLLYEEMRSRIAYLERQVEEEHEARRRADTLLARLMDNIPALEAPESREEGAQEPAETGAGGLQQAGAPGRSEPSERPRDATESPRRGSLTRPWWRRMFGG